MNSRRTAKVAQTLREVVSTTVLFGLRDPRIKNVTILSVDVSSDMRRAKVFVSVMGDEKAEKLALHGLNSARGFIQSKIADRIKSRYIPVLSFEIDDGVKKSFEATRILKEVLPDMYDDEGDDADAQPAVTPDLSDVNEATAEEQDD